MRCSPSAAGNGLAAYASRMLAIVRCQDWRRRRNPARDITESAVPRSPIDAGSGMVPVSEKAALNAPTPTYRCRSAANRDPGTDPGSSSEDR